MKPGSENVETWIESAVTPGSVPASSVSPSGASWQSTPRSPNAPASSRLRSRPRPSCSTIVPVVAASVDSESRPHAATTRTSALADREQAESLHRSPSSANCRCSPAGRSPGSAPCDAKPDAPSDPARETAASHARVQAAAVCHPELAVCPVDGRSAEPDAIHRRGVRRAHGAGRTARWSSTPSKT